MISLPVCRWRGEVRPSGRYSCNSPSIMCSPSGVREETCLGCSLCDHEPKEPGMIQKAVNLGVAVVEHTLAGFPQVTEEQHRIRAETCRSCPMFKDGICLHPGCGCGILRKAWWKEQKCPLKRWPEIE